MFNSSLFNERTFYSKFRQDLSNCTREVVIESPFISTYRISTLYSVLTKLRQKGVKIYIVTRDPREHSFVWAKQAVSAINDLKSLGITVFFCEKSHHRKLAILDRKTLWEGSLNILSQTNSLEIMRRIEGTSYAQEMLTFSNLGKYIS